MRKAEKVKKESEKNTERNLVRLIEKLDGQCYKLSSAYMLGMPDRLVLMPGGRVWFVETKSEGDSPRLAQKAKHRLLRRLGFKVEVVSTKEQLDIFIHKIVNDGMESI